MTRREGYSGSPSPPGAELDKLASVNLSKGICVKSEKVAKQEGVLLCSRNDTSLTEMVTERQPTWTQKDGGNACYSKCGPQTSSISSPGSFVRDEASPSTY